MQSGFFIPALPLQQRIRWLAIAALVLLWGAAAVVGYSNYKNAHEQMDRQTSVLAATLAQQTSATFRLADHLMSGIRSEWLNTPVRTGWQVPPQHSAYLRDLIAHISIVDANGQEVLSTLDADRSPVAWADRYYFNTHKNSGRDEVLVSSPFKDALTGKWHIDVSRPLWERGAFVGVMVLSIEPEYFSRFFKTVGLGKQGLVSLVSDNGTMMARSLDPGRFIGGVIRSAPFLVPGADIAGHFHHASPLDGVARSYGYVRIPDYQVTLVAAVGIDEQMAPLTQQRLVFMGIAICVTLLLILTARSLMRSVGRRETAENQLREAQSRYQGLVESLPVGVVVHRNGKFLYVNPAAVAILGARSADALLGQPILEIVHPDFREAAVARIKFSLETGQAMPPYEEKFLKIDGTVIDVEVRGNAITFEGEPASQVSFQDITERKKVEQALHASEEKWRSIIANSVNGISIFSVHGLLEKSSQGMLKMFGYANEEEILGRPLDDFADTASLARIKAVVADLAQGGYVGALEGWAIRKDGTRFLAEAQVDVLHNAQGEATQIIFMVRDISEHKRSQEELRLAASVFTHAREGIMITDAAGTIVAVNETFSHITGYHRREVLGQSPRILNSGRQGDEFYETMWKAIVDAGHWSGEVWNRRKNGEVYAEMLTISVVLDDEHKPQNYVSLFTDITPMKEYQSQLERIAHYDALTNLPNRVLFADRLRQAVVHSQRRKRLLSVVYLDLDGFKAVNDAHGHAVGDELLIVVAQRMKIALRDGDSLARVGGDEFVAVLVDLDRPADCEPVLGRLLAAASGPVTVQTATGPVNLQVSASIGATIYPRDGSDADLLMRHADQAMYLAKQAGKNRFHLFDTDRDAAVKTQRESVERVRKALECNELVLHYQPKVNMLTRDVVGAEALVRWQHPERGLLAPAEFLPIIENHPLSVAMGEWVMNTALTQIAVWKALGLDLPVSVNMGAYQLQQPNFVENLKASLARHPLVPRFRLELEILETSAIEDLAQVSGILRACRAEGVLFSVDDFGTGYSSLTYLKHLPAETLKIDQSFVRGMLSDPDDMAIVSGVIGLAKAFGRKVIAEGVETDAHGEKLIALGCPVAQGYGIARPMPAEQMVQWVQRWKSLATA